MLKFKIVLIHTETQNKTTRNGNYATMVLVASLQTKSTKIFVLISKTSFATEIAA